MLEGKDGHAGGRRNKWIKAWENTGVLMPKSGAIIVLSILSAICRHVNLPFQVPQRMTE